MDRIMLGEIEKYFGTQIQDVVNIEIGNSPGVKIRFRLNGKLFFAKELPYDRTLLEKYRFLAQIRGTIPEAVIPKTIVALKESRIIAISEYINNGTTLDAVYPELSIRERIVAGMQVGSFMKRLHSSLLFSKSDSQDIDDDRIQSIITSYVPAEKRDMFYNLICLRKSKSVKGPYSLIHRDIRPQNIIWGEDGRIKIIDFENAELAPKMYDLSLCLMLSEKYNEFKFGTIYGYYMNNVPNAFWTEEKQHIAWQLLEYADRYQNDRVSIERKFNMLCEYITSDKLLPDWWIRVIKAELATKKF